MALLVDGSYLLMKNLEMQDQKGQCLDFSKPMLPLEMFERGEPFIYSAVFIECLRYATPYTVLSSGGKVVGKREKVSALRVYILLGRGRHTNKQSTKVI